MTSTTVMNVLYVLTDSPQVTRRQILVHVFDDYRLIFKIPLLAKARNEQ